MKNILEEHNQSYDFIYIYLGEEFLYESTHYLYIELTPLLKPSRSHQKNNKVHILSECSLLEPVGDFELGDVFSSSNNLYNIHQIKPFKLGEMELEILIKSLDPDYYNKLPIPQIGSRRKLLIDLLKLKLRDIRLDYVLS